MMLTILLDTPIEEKTSWSCCRNGEVSMRTEYRVTDCGRQGSCVSAESREGLY